MKASWIIGLAAPAVALAYDPNTLVPAGPLRHAVASVGTLAILALAYGGPRPGGDTERPLPRALSGVGWALAAWLGLATLAGVDRWPGLTGTPDRRFGLITWLITIASVGAGARLKGHRRAASLGASLAAVTLGVVSVAEMSGWIPSGSLAANGRWSGLWGQPAFLASAALLFGFVAVGEAVDAQNGVLRRALGWLGASGAGLALLGSGTRGAMVGAAVGALLWLTLNRPSRRITTGISMAGIGILLVAASQARGFSRLDEWAIGWRAVRASPWLGYGPEGYRIVFGRHVTEAYRLAYGADTYTDRAHQGLIDLALVGGLTAVFLFVMATAVAARAVWRRRDQLGPAETAMVAAVGAYLLAQQALFPIASLEPLAALYLGMVVAGPARRSPPACSLRRLAPLAATTLLLALAGGAEVLAERGLAAEAATNRIDTEPVLNSVSLRPDSFRVHYAAAQLLASRGTILDLDQALDQLEDGLYWSPKDPALNQRYLELLVRRAQRSLSEPDARAAWDQAQQVLATNPLDPGALRAASDAADLVGETARSDELRQRANTLYRENSAD